MLTVKHYLADYLFQPHTLALGKAHPTHWRKPLLIHSAVHGGMALVIFYSLTGLLTALALAAIDFTLHLLIDYWKAQKVQYTPAERKFWLVQGIDQMLHHLTYLALAFIAIHLAGG